MPNRIKWTIVHYKPPEGMTLNGDGVGGVKVKLMAKVTPKDDGSVVSFDVHLGGPALFGPIGMIVAAALRSDIRESLQNFVTVFTGPDPGMNRGAATASSVRRSDWARQPGRAGRRSALMSQS